MKPRTYSATINGHPVVRFPNGVLATQRASVAVDWPRARCATVATARALAEGVAEKLGIDNPEIGVTSCDH